MGWWKQFVQSASIFSFNLYVFAGEDSVNDKKLEGKEVESDITKALSIFIAEVLHVFYYFCDFPDNAGAVNQLP